jgi:tetratricopeptide (TPR) repeat protein
MRQKLYIAIQLLTLAFGCLLPYLAAYAQTAPLSSLEGQLRAQYKPGEATASVLVIQMDGVVGVPPGSPVICPLKFQDGSLHSPDGSCLVRAQKPTRLLKAGEKVNPNKIEVSAKDDLVVMTFTECDSCNMNSGTSSYKSAVSFQFPKGYLGAADSGQIVDVISQVLTLDAPPVTSAIGQSQSPEQQALTNADIVKMVQAHLPESVVLAKIKSSTCEFDTSPDALIKLNQAGASQSVLQAIVETMIPPSTSDVPPADAVCSDYGDCVSKGKAALDSSQWDDAIAIFQTASNLDPSKPNAWLGIGAVYWETARYEEAATMFDKVLALGSTINVDVCRQHFLSCDRGSFRMSTKEVSLVSPAGQKVFSARLSEVTTQGAQLFGQEQAAYVAVRVSGKNYSLFYIPDKITCNFGLVPECPEPGLTQQKLFANYVHRTILKIAAGEFAKKEQPLTPK